MTIISNMSNADYHSHAAVSKTQLDQIAKSPAHFKHARESETESTQAMIFGSAFHDFILLPDVFAESYKAMPCNAGAKHPDIMLSNARLILLRHFNEMVSRLERKTDHSRAVLTAAQYGIFDINQLLQ